MSEGRHARTWLFLGLVLSAVLVSGSAASAGPPPSTLLITVQLRDREVFGVFGLPDTSVSIKQKRHGSVIAAKTTTADDTGSFRARVKQLLPGDRLVIKQAAIARTITIPDIQVRVNAGTDVASGHVPTSSLEGTLRTSNNVGSFTLGQVVDAFTADPDGSFSKTVSQDVQGGDEVELEWHDGAGDVFTAIDVPASVIVRVASASVEVFGRPGSHVTVTLRSSSGTLRGSAAVTPGVFGNVTGTFRKNGQPVKVKAGDRVVHSAAPLIKLKVRPDDLQVVGTANGSLTATCFGGGAYVAGRLFGGGAFDYLANGSVDPGGAISATDLTNGGGDLPSGTHIGLMCETPKGFTELMTDTVP